MSTFRSSKPAPPSSRNIRVKLTRSSSYAGTVSNQHDYFDEVSNKNYFHKLKRREAFRRSDSNFDTVGYTYHSNAIRAIKKGIEIDIYKYIYIYILV